MTRYSLIFLLVLAMFGTGCTVNTDIMFKTPTDYEFDTLKNMSDVQFRLQPNDVMQFRLFANDGFRLIDLVSEDKNTNNSVQRNTFSYLVEYDGLAKMPLLGRVPLAGKTVREAELWLEEQYTTYYNRPFVQVSVLNRRVVVFPGGGGDAKVITIDNNNTTMLEVIASAGGLPKRGKASRIKLFRRKPEGGRSVYLFDLSDIQGLKYADIIMQSDDIIYVQPNPDIARELLYDITPVLTLLTSVILVIGIARSF